MKVNKRSPSQTLSTITPARGPMSKDCRTTRPFAPFRRMFVESLSMSLKKRVGMVPAVLSVWVSPEDDTKRKLGVFLYTICCAGLTKVQVPFELRPLSSLVNSQQIPLYKRAY